MNQAAELTETGTETLLLSCPVCESDAAESLGVTGDMADATTGTVILQCDDCDAVYLSPQPEPPAGSARGPGRPVWPERPRHRRWLGPLPPEPERLTAGASLRDVPAGSQQYRLIVMPYLLESAERPAALLQHAASLLAPDGRIILVAGNAASSSFRLFAGRHWSGYRYPLARQLFGPRSIRRLADGSRLRVSRMTSAYSSDHWLESLRNCLVDWDASAPLTRILAGPWGLPRALAALAEAVAVLRGRGSILLAELAR